MGTPADGANQLPEDRDLTTVAAAIAATTRRIEQPSTGAPPVTGAELLDALVLVCRAQTQLAGLQPILIAAARAAGVS